jgi:hypothetical protein
MTAELQATMLNHLNKIRLGMNDLYRSAHSGVLRLESQTVKEGFSSVVELERLIREFKVTLPSR